MSALREIRKRLGVLRRRRQRNRWATAYAALVITILCVLAGLFALDVQFELSVAQRAAMLVIAAVIIIWSFQRFTRPFLGVYEDETSLALYVERQHGIDSDLVAALQFEQPEAANWGSPQLETAVVSRVAQLTPQINVFEGLRYDRLLRRLQLLAVTVIVVAAIVALYPRHVAVFLSRLAFSGRHYPSDTNIEHVLVNGDLVLQWNPMHAQPRDVNCPESQPVSFVVHSTGILPDQGIVECRSRSNRSSRSLELRRLTADERQQLRQQTTARLAEYRTGKTKSATRIEESLAQLEQLLANWPEEDSRTALYTAELPQLVETFQYSVRLGDAWTDLADVRMIDLPAVEVAVKVIPPEYARASTLQPESSRHVAVLEGSQVQLTVRSANQKHLRSAVVRFAEGGQTRAFPLTKQDDEGLEWSLTAADSPLSRVTQEIRYEIQVTDVDGLQLQTPLHGFVQLKLDRPPTGMAQVVHRVLLPQAKPLIEFRMNDDYGISAARLQAQVERQNASTEGPAASAVPVTPIELPLDPRPLVGQNLPYRGQYALDLSPLKLAKGDQLKVTLEVVDYRGTAQGRSYLSEPLLLEISDEAGVLAAITAADERSEKRLSDLIQQQLGVGESR